ncbi:MAG TPA: helix-hairpin-helix domain-containing protein [Acidimicrobiales bacterium]
MASTGSTSKAVGPTDPDSLLQTIRNAGPATAGDLLVSGINQRHNLILIGLDGDRLHEESCRLHGVRREPCVRDLFAAIIDFTEGGPSQPWWAFTPTCEARGAARTKPDSFAP